MAEPQATLIVEDTFGETLRVTNEVDGSVYMSIQHRRKGLVSVGFSQEETKVLKAWFASLPEMK